MRENFFEKALDEQYQKKEKPYFFSLLSILICEFSIFHRQ
jgi:hypothetical protein